MAWTFWREGQGEKALQGYEQAAELFKGTDDVQGELWANNGIASLNSDLGQYDEARAGYLNVLEVARQNSQAIPEAIALNNLGTLEYSLGRSDVALEHFQQALAIHTQLKNKRNQLNPMFNISISWNQLGNYQEAQKILEQALALCDQEGYRDLRSLALIKLAKLEAQQKHFNKAVSLIETAMADSETVRHKDLIEGRIELGEAFRQTGNLVAAGEQFALADSLLGDKNFDWVRLRLVGNQARLLLEQGKFQVALDRYQGFIDLVEKTGFSEFRVAALAGAGQASLSLGLVEEARSYYEEASQAWEDDRRLLLSPQWREQRGAGGRRVFAELALLVHESGQSEAAFDLLQNYKARTLMERMLGPGEAFQSHLALADSSLVGLSDLQNDVLAEDEVLLDFTLGLQRSLVFAVSRDTLVLRQLPPAEEITAKVFSVFNLHKHPGAGSASALAAAGASLADLLLDDLPEIFANQNHFLVAADGAVNLLPFSALEIDGQPRVWTRVPSAPILSKMRRVSAPSQANQGPMLAIGSSWAAEGQVIPGALAEVEYLADRYDQVEKVILTGNAEISLDLEPYHILHFAAHTSNNDQTPWQSAIHFRANTEADENAGLLRAADILQLDLSAQLAVLSSCSSGSGRVLNGEGVVGLSSAFFSVGVPTVVASLWAVDDGATARFMKLFYANLAAGQECADALSHAQGEMRSQPATAHPYYWAGFVVIGDGARTIQLQESTNGRILAWLAFLVALVGLGLALARYK